MKFVEILNAVSMISPLIAWIKHKRRKSNDCLHKYLPLQIVVSVAYHTCSALSNNNRLVHLLRVIDISSIHICSFFCSLGGIRRVRNELAKTIVKCISVYASVPFLLFDIIANLIRRNHVDTRIRMMIILQNNIFFLGILPVNESMSLIKTTTLCFHFYKNTDRGLSHVYFHLLLYDVFNDYWTFT